MMFCPQCKAEYRPGFIRCSDCDVELVDCLPPEIQEPKTTEEFDYVAIRRVQRPFEEGQICSFLQANGIPAQARSLWVRRDNAIGTGPVEILVPRDCVVNALELLAKADRGDLEIEPEDEP
jgi:hypothetical protein